MHIRAHLAAAAAAGLALYPRNLSHALLVIAGGVCIDIDHFILYGLRSGDWSIIGAFQYNHRRHRPIRPGDTRPRYGSLRSILHRPYYTLPLLWFAAIAWPLLRPFAAGVSLHLAMDIYIPHYDWRAWERAAGRCERCNLPGLEREVYYIVPPERGGDYWALANRAVWCQKCAQTISRASANSNRKEQLAEAKV